MSGWRFNVPHTISDHHWDTNCIQDNWAFTMKHHWSHCRRRQILGPITSGYAEEWPDKAQVLHDGGLYGLPVGSTNVPLMTLFIFNAHLRIRWADGLWGAIRRSLDGTEASANGAITWNGITKVATLVTDLIHSVNANLSEPIFL